MRDFTNYDVWKIGVDVAVKIYALTKYFPFDERFGLISQIRRASVSISSNIAEGCSRSSEKEFSSFIEIALGSLFEVKTQLYISTELKFIKKSEFDLIVEKLDVLGKKLNSLRNKLIANG
ncbi:MAG: four helix bundle protein [Reichenbachiella sp.]